MTALVQVIEEAAHNMTSNMVTKADHEKVRLVNIAVVNTP